MSKQRDDDLIRAALARNDRLLYGIGATPKDAAELIFKNHDVKVSAVKIAKIRETMVDDKSLAWPNARIRRTNSVSHLFSGRAWDRMRVWISRNPLDPAWDTVRGVVRRMRGDRVTSNEYAATESLKSAGINLSGGGEWKK